jgi:hypothetical protein
MIEEKTPVAQQGNIRIRALVTQDRLLERRPASQRGAQAEDGSI